MRETRNSSGSTAGALALAMLVFFLTAGSCAQPPDTDTSEPEFDLNNPVAAQPKQPAEPEIGADIIGMDAETIWKARCDMCHAKERGLDHFVGEEWQPIIERMMKKPGALMNAGIAGMIYVYLYECTTGELHPDRDELLHPPVNTSGSQQFMGGQN
ncbi:hypothetical protein J7J84_06610 [bacterium]|nr:hypothetical protein [bacterium]